MITTFDDNVVYLHPADQGSMHSLVLTMGNSARQSERLLTEIGQANAEIGIQAQSQGDLAKSAGILSGELHDIMAQLERCHNLWVEFKTT